MNIRDKPWPINVGDRVKLSSEISATDHGVDGTVISVDEYYIHVRRDDDDEGSGTTYHDHNGIVRYSWVVSWREFDNKQIAVIIKASGTVATLPEKHMAGLSPETIDPAAYDAFMRDLQT